MSYIFLFSYILAIRKPPTSPQKGDPIFRKVKSDMVIRKDTRAPNEKCPEKAEINVFFKTINNAIPPKDAIKPGGQDDMNPVKNGEKIPNAIQSKAKIIPLV